MRPRHRPSVGAALQPRDLRTLSAIGEGYVRLAEQTNGPIPRRNGSSYVWGAALGQLERMQPDGGSSISKQL